MSQAVKDPSKDFFTGLIRIHILHHLSGRPWYGQELKEELEEHGYAVSYGTLYPILARLHAAGLVTREERNVGGRIRKYYTATKAGEKILKEARIRVRELVDEILDDTKE